MINQPLPPTSFIVKDADGRAYRCARIHHLHGGFIRQVITIPGIGKMTDNAIYGYDNDSISAMIKRSKLIAGLIIADKRLGAVLAA